MIDRVKQVTQKRAYLYKVTKIGIFGSYLSNQELINDIDIAIVLEPKEENFEKHKALIWEKVVKAKKQGRKFANFTDELLWPQIEVLNYLKWRSRVLSLQVLSHSEFDAMESKLVVYGNDNQSNNRLQQSN